ncbi:DUF3147 family protein [Edaphobacter paludis]|uniref:DUF3147 family protein n=1 Tax=Edaphobacter paludis TaxID=3035702 RepID=A0AAU7D9K9_9BACT
MKIEADLSALKTVKPHEYAVRFFFGGLVTVLAGLIAKHYGPVVGGLFLAFPAIFPASATLIEKHEKQKKQRAGLDGTRRGREAASVDAAGASLGAIGLIAFAVILWRYLPSPPAWLVLVIGAIAWLALSILLWVLRKLF